MQRSLASEARRIAVVALIVALAAVVAPACRADASADGGDRKPATPAPSAVPVPQPEAAPRESATSSGASVGAGEFGRFWGDFRRAALAGDTAAVAAMTAFPFRTRGPLDDDPPFVHDRAAFVALLPRLLAEDPGLSARRSTMRSLLEETANPRGEVVDGDEARVGGFVFMRRDGRWLFVRAFLSESSGG